jgi:hypothetical protein
MIESGIYYRLYRDDKWQSVELFDMDEHELRYILRTRTIVEMERIIKRVCEVVREVNRNDG